MKNKLNWFLFSSNYQIKWIATVLLNTLIGDRCYPISGRVALFDTALACLLRQVALDSNVTQDKSHVSQLGPRERSSRPPGQVTWVSPVINALLRHTSLINFQVVRRLLRSTPFQEQYFELCQLVFEFVKSADFLSMSLKIDYRPYSIIFC